MSRSYSVDELKKFASLLRDKLGLQRVLRLRMLAVLDRMREVFPNFEYKRVPDDRFAGAEGLYDPEKNLLTIPDRIFKALERDDPRANFTIAHELAHWALGHKGIRFRHTIPQAYERSVGEYKRDERQAYKFAAFFLAPDSLAETCKSIEELEKNFGLSHQAAKIRLDEVELHIRRNTGQSRPLPDKVVNFFTYADSKGYKISPSIKRQIGEPSTLSDFERATQERAKAAITKQTPAGHFRSHAGYINDFCTNCGQQTLFPLGSKFKCDSCKFVFDPFQDSDRADL